MDDLKPSAEASNLRVHGTPWPGTEEPPLPRGFVPLRLVLYPGGCAVSLTRPDMVVGRHSSVDLRLHLPDVSRRHCRFVFAEGSWQLFDLDSLNGVFVNDQVVDQAALHQGDKIRIGSYTFEVDLTNRPDADALPSNGLKTLGNIADLLAKPQDHSQRQAS
jgi:predicted component of type VI protein secretion system